MSRRQCRHCTGVGSGIDNVWSMGREVAVIASSKLCSSFFFRNFSELGKFYISKGHWKWQVEKCWDTFVSTSGLVPSSWGLRLNFHNLGDEERQVMRDLWI